MRISETVFFRHKYLAQLTLTPEDMIIKVLQDLKHAIKGTKNYTGNKNTEALVKMDEVFKQEDESDAKEDQERAKRMQFLSRQPKVLNYSPYPRVPIGRAASKKASETITTVPVSKSAPALHRPARKLRSSGAATAAAPMVPAARMVTPPRVHTGTLPRVNMHSQG